MYGRYRDDLRRALDLRKQQSLPDIRPLLVWVTASTLLFVLFALFVAPEGRDADYHFLSERGLVTAMSAYLLAAASAFCLAALTVQLRDQKSNIRLWVLMALGFAFLSLDETAQFHERLGDLLDDGRDSGAFRTWNDIVVILYGIVALPIVLALLPDILRYKMLLELFVVAFLLYAIHTLIDSTQEPPTTVSIILEESAKLFCGAFLALGTFVGFKGVLWSSKRSGSDTS